MIPITLHPGRGNAHAGRDPEHRSRNRAASAEGAAGSDLNTTTENMDYEIIIALPVWKSEHAQAALWRKIQGDSRR